MSKINVLSKNVIDKIAAGEVIERPLNVVKELVENSIDAGATMITVEIKDGGKSFIRVTDNGCGIARDDLLTAFKRHATSKLKEEEDLYNIKTLGFRGEALASISAVSVMEVITKDEASMTGIRLRVEGGELGEVEEVGAPCGTTMYVKNLFFNTPARKKFLKSDATEGSYIASLIEHLALANSHISMRFIQNGKTKINTSASDDVKNIIYSLYGREFINDLIPIDVTKEGVRLSGYLVKPGISRGNRNYENFFVNRRYINSKVISRGVEEAYKTFVMQHKFPCVFLFIDLKESDVDVNVHPTKMEVKFANEELIYDMLVEHIRRVLSGDDLIVSSFLEDESEIKEEVREETETSVKFEPFEVSKLKPYNAAKDTNLIKVKEAIRGESPYARRYGEPRTLKEEMPEKIEKAVKEETLPLLQKYHFLEEDNRKKHKIIGQIFDTYFLVTMEDSLYIIDQHAAHERIMFERLMKNLKNHENFSQEINPPMVVTLTDKEKVLLAKYIENFKTIGFEIEGFGGNEVIISAVPYNMYGINDKELFLSMIDSLDEFTGNELPQVVIDKIAMMSCKAAVKGNNRLSIMEANAIIDELLKLDNPYHCPHGRPTIVELSKGELERRFKR